MHFSNLSIRTRIGAGFTAIVAMVILLGSLALSELGTVNASTERIASGNLPSVKLAARMGDLTQLIRRAEARHVMSDSPDEWAAQDARIAQTRKQLAELEPEVTRLYDSEEERRELADYRSRRDAWYALWEQQLRPLSLQGPAHAAEAQKLYVGESSKAFNLTLESIQKIAQINADEAVATWAEAQATYARSRLLVSACIGVAALLAIALAWVISSSIARPIDAAVQAAGAIAGGDMTKSLHASGTDETARLLQGLESMRQSLVKVVTHVRQGSERVAAASSEIAMGNQDLSARTEAQASALAQSAASMEQLSAQVQHNAGNARLANQSASAASSVAARGGAAVGRVVQTMKEIHDASQRIADIIAVIDSIAFQTNILALNAAVEAARAGEQGRGFAVVASEVRQLAGRCAEAAKEIKQLIGASVERVEQGRTLVDEAGSTMEEVVTAIRRVTDLMGEIHSASNEQAAGVQQVGDAVAQMDHATQQNAALVEEMAAAAGSLRSQAAELVHAVAVFHLDASNAPAGDTPLRLT